MERRITEEQLTKIILTWLENNGWEIICFDFPQAGTGILLHPNNNIRSTKNKGSIIPDIVAIKNKTVVFIEDKDRFSPDDFLKVEELIKTDDYSTSIQKLLKGFEYSNIFYGVGLPISTNTVTKTIKNKEKIDFALFVSEDNSVSVKHQIKSIFF